MELGTFQDMSLVLSLWGYLCVSSADLAVEELQGEDLVPRPWFDFSASLMMPLPLTSQASHA